MCKWFLIFGCLAKEKNNVKVSAFFIEYFLTIKIVPKAAPRISVPAFLFWPWWWISQVYTILES
jgi:hypothetical protein